MPSKVKELADAEAAKAEAEPDENETADAEESEAVEGGPAQPNVEPSADPTEEDKQAFDTEQARHAEVLRAIMGPDFDLLEPCDACGTWGYAPPILLKANDRYKMCETCNGLGNVLTGARLETSATAMCPACQGRGYLEKLNVPAPPQEGYQQPANGAETYGTPPWMGSPEVKPEPVYGPPA